MADNRVVIVGNAPIARDLTSVVDGADVVFRFNHCPGYGAGRTGTRTSVVVFGAVPMLLGIGGPERNRLIQETTRLPEVLATRPQVWFVRDDQPELAERAIDHFGLHDHVVRRLPVSDLTALLHKFKRIMGGPLGGVSPDDFPDFRPFVDPETGLACQPTAGLAVIDRVVHDPAFADHRVQVTGFSWHDIHGAQWEGHPYPAERRLCEIYQEEQRIELLPFS